MEAIELANEKLLAARRNRAGSISRPERVRTTLPVSDLVCEKHGCKKEGVGGFGDSVFYYCQACADERDQQEREREDSKRKAAKRALVEKRFAECQIGERFRGVSFESYKPATAKAATVLQACRAYAEHFDESLVDGAGLILLGGPGTGKNHLAAAICNTIIQNEHSALHTTVMKTIRRVKGTWGKDAQETEQHAILAFCEPELLVLDEVGVQFGSDTEKLLLTEIINERYERLRPTILISNLSASDLVGTLGERVVDRFRDGGELLVFDWQSYRKRSRT